MRDKYRAAGERGRHSWQAVQFQMQGAVDLWREQNVEACRQMRSDDPGVAAQGERRQACSRRAAAALRLASDRLMDAGADRLTERVALGGGLRTIVDCNNGFAPDSERSFELARHLDASLIAVILGDRTTAREQAQMVLDQTADDEYVGLRSQAYNTLKWYYTVVGDSQGVAAATRAGLAAAELAGNTDVVAQLWGDLAWEAAEQGDFDRAHFCPKRVEQYAARDELSPGRVVSTMYIRGRVLRTEGKLDQAIATLQEATDRDREVRPGSVILAWGLSDLALALRADGRLDAARRVARESVETMRDRLSNEHPDVAVMRTRWGAVLLDLGELPAARTQLELALDVLSVDPEAFADVREQAQALLRRADASPSVP